MYVQTESSDLIRDTQSRAIFPKRSALEEFRANKAKEERVLSIESRVSSIEEKLDMLLSLLGGKV